MPEDQAEPSSLSERDVQRWLDRFFECWRTADAERGARLFALDAVFTESLYEERWPHGKRMHGRAEVLEYWREVTTEWPFIDGGYELWAVKGDAAFGRLWADLRSRTEGYWVPLAHAFEAVFTADGEDDDGTLACSSWREWKPEIPERLRHHEPHRLDRLEEA